MNIFSAVAKLFSGLVTAFNAWQEDRKQKRLIRLGQLEQEAENRDKTDAAEDRMDAVKPATEKETIDALKGGKF